MEKNSVQVEYLVELKRFLKCSGNAIWVLSKLEKIPLEIPPKIGKNSSGMSDFE